MSSNLFHPWFHIVTSKWLNTPHIEVYQLRILAQNTVPQIFFPALSRFIVQYQHPDYSKAQVQALSELFHVPFLKISVFHHLKIFSMDAYSLNPLDEVVTDSIHVDPSHFDKYGKVVPGRFDTAIIQIRDAPDLDIKGIYD